MTPMFRIVNDSTDGSSAQCLACKALVPHHYRGMYCSECGVKWAAGRVCRLRGYPRWAWERRDRHPDYWKLYPQQAEGSHLYLRERYITEDGSRTWGAGWQTERAYGWCLMSECASDRADGRLQNSRHQLTYKLENSREFLDELGHPWTLQVQPTIRRKGGQRELPDLVGPVWTYYPRPVVG